VADGAFHAGGDVSIFFSGPAKAEGGTGFLSRRAGSSGISWPILYLVKKTIHCHRAGFEPQRESPFRKKMKAPQILGKATRARTMTPLFLLVFTLLVVLACWLACSTSDDQYFFVIVTLFRPQPHRDWGRAGTAGSRFARDDKELGPQLGVTITRKTVS
jgi:hypothetical protein